MFNIVRFIFLILFFMAISTSQLWALPYDGGAAPVPEIDPSLASSAIALITGGLLILRGKSKRK